MDPPVLIQRVRRWQSIEAVCQLVGLAMLLISSCLGFDAIIYLALPFAVATFFSGWIAGSQRSRYSRLANEHAFLLCGNCAYPLGAIVASAQTERLRCPECGTEQASAAVEAAWRAEFEVKPSPPRKFLPESVGVQVACYAGILAALVFIGYLVSISF
ncbi:MAG: hypothetical protein IT450_01815 [Phycisphaerales bacterium]|nr:hypothetical protein [Phycisphaerales bacterium]